MCFYVQGGSVLSFVDALGQPQYMVIWSWPLQNAQKSDCLISTTCLITTRKLSIPDIMFNRKGLVLFVWQLKMYTHTEAEEQQKLSIFGNWRKRVLAMGGATSVGGIVTHSKFQDVPIVDGRNRCSVTGGHKREYSRLH